ncbi:hypothetical protein ACP3V3_02410 [Vibrio sp. PNB22_3_1]
MTVGEATNVELDYEYFLERYKDRRTVWARMCKISFVIALGFAPFVYDFFSGLLGVDGIIGVFLLAAAALVAVVGAWEFTVNVAERILGHSYLKPYMLIEEGDSIIVHGYIRDSARPRFQLWLRRQFPGYELDMDLAARRRCAYVLVRRKSSPIPELPVRFS